MVHCLLSLDMNDSLHWFNMCVSYPVFHGVMNACSSRYIFLVKLST
jgi:hypothetical protein